MNADRLCLFFQELSVSSEENPDHTDIELIQVRHCGHLIEHYLEVSYTFLDPFQLDVKLTYPFN